MPDFGSAALIVMSWLLLGALFAVPVMVLLKAWIEEHTIGAGAALGTMAGLLGMLGVIWRLAGTGWAFLWSLLVAAACLALPRLVSRADQRAYLQLVEENIARYEAAIARDPKNAAAHAYLADAYLELGRTEEAIGEYRKAIDLDPAHAEAERAKLQRALGASPRLRHPSPAKAAGEGPETLN